MNPVDTLRQEYKDIEQYLADNTQVSMLNDFNKTSRKVLLLSASSYFEHEVTKVLKDFVSNISNGDERIINFLQKQAISGKYHQIFDWGSTSDPTKSAKNANKFWSLFGEDFRKSIDEEIKDNQNDTPEVKLSKKNIRESIEGFLEIGHQRNVLVHSNFALYNYEQKTIDEIYDLFKKAEPFVEYLRSKLLL